MEIIKPSVTIETPLNHIEDYLELIERFGRTCHQTEEVIQPGSAEKFIDKYLIGLGHESVLEHCSISVRFICDRSASHQLVRHRIGSFSQESQRAVDYSKHGLLVICPPSIARDETLLEEWKKQIEVAEGAYRKMLEAGIPTEDARSLLPNCTKTEVIATFNLRQWRHIFEQRALNPHAQWQIRQLMTELLKDMHRLLPVVFHDLQQKILYKLVFKE